MIARWETRNSWTILKLTLEKLSDIMCWTELAQHIPARFSFKQ
jgi:hypothetical protein